MPLFVYISGPYTKPDPIVNVSKAITVADTIMAMGHYPFIPHLTCFWHMMHPHAYERWIEYDLQWIRKCDVLFRIPGESPGSDREVDFAISLGIWVVYGMADFHHYLDTRSCR